MCESPARVLSTFDSLLIKLLLRPPIIINIPGDCPAVFVARTNGAVKTRSVAGRGDPAVAPPGGPLGEQEVCQEVRACGAEGPTPPPSALYEEAEANEATSHKNPRLFPDFH